MTAHVPKNARTGDARTRAAEVLARVEAEGAFAAPVLDAAIERAPKLEARDRALATELVYGTLRSIIALDAAMGRHARDGEASLRKLDAYTRAVMRVAAYQILGLSKVPPRAAVGEAVEAVKRSRSPRLAGFVNAILRKITADREEPLPDDARVTLALKSVPTEVYKRMALVLGEENTIAHLRAALEGDYSVVLRTNTHKVARDALILRLRAELPEAVITEGRVSPLAVRIQGGGDPSKIAPVREGIASVQEEAAQCVALMGEIQRGMSVLDTCAGRGGKSAVAALQLAGRGVLHAVDLFPEKLVRLREELTRMDVLDGLTLETAAADLTCGIGTLVAKRPPNGYDVVLVDVPCSGIGTLSHRPDLMFRLRDRDAWDTLVDVQKKVLATAAEHVAPGGVLVYSVCSLTHDEGDNVVEQFLNKQTQFTLAKGSASLPERLRASRVVFTANGDKTDGFMAWRFRRSS
jgi:16S rRNA (cytosine967-C5)-methyltransferase